MTGYLLLTIGDEHTIQALRSTAQLKRGGVTLPGVTIVTPTTTDPLLAHAGHPADWLPFVVPLLLVAVLWFVIRAREAAAAEDTERDDEDESDTSVGGG
jgi:hypothetical protein